MTRALRCSVRLEEQLEMHPGDGFDWRFAIETLSIVVGLDGSDDCGRGLGWAIDLARNTGGEVLAVHAVNQPVPTSWSAEARADLLATVHSQAMESLESWAAPLRGAGVPHRILVVDGAPADALLQVAADVDAAMIVVGRRGLGGFTRLLLGSVSYRVIQQSPIPVVVIPPAGEA